MATDTKGGFWNYRVVRIKDGDDFMFQIHEAHYRANQRDAASPVPHSITTEPVTADGETGFGLWTALEQMQKALILPALDYNTRKPINAHAAILEGLP